MSAGIQEVSAECQQYVILCQKCVSSVSRVSSGVSRVSVNVIRVSFICQQRNYVKRARQQWSSSYLLKALLCWTDASKDISVEEGDGEVGQQVDGQLLPHQLPQAAPPPEVMLDHLLLLSLLAPPAPCVTSCSFFSLWHLLLPVSPPAHSSPYVPSCSFFSLCHLLLLVSPQKDGETTRHLSHDAILVDVVRGPLVLVQLGPVGGDGGHLGDLPGPETGW